MRTTNTGGPLPERTDGGDGGRDLGPTPTAVRRVGDDADGLDLAVVCDPDTDTVRVRGQLTVATAGRLRTLKLRADPTGVRPVQIDLGGVAVIDAAGVAAVTAFARQSRLAGRPLTVVKPAKPAAAAMAAMTGVLDLLRTVPPETPPTGSSPAGSSPDRSGGRP